MVRWRVMRAVHLDNFIYFRCFYPVKDCQVEDDEVWTYYAAEKSHRNLVWQPCGPTNRLRVISHPDGVDVEAEEHCWSDELVSDLADEIPYSTSIANNGQTTHMHGLAHGTCEHELMHRGTRMNQHMYMDNEPSKKHVPRRLWEVLSERH